MIEISNVSFGYSKKQNVFDQLNLNMGQGKIHGLLGKNGAGKSTLLKLMSGFLPPRTGEIKVNNFNPFKREPGFYQTIYFLPEDIEFANLSISDFIKACSGFYPSFDINKMNVLTNDFELNLKSRIGELSFGQRKKLFLSFGFAADFKILYLDEPTIGLDISAKALFRKILAEEISEDKIVVLSTHQIDDIDKLLDHVVIINNGKVELNASLEHLSNTISFQQITNINDDTKFLYKQKTPLGFNIILECESVGNDIDLPALYSAVLTDNAFTKKLNDLLTAS